jgi:hypothetical protein
MAAEGDFFGFISRETAIELLKQPCPPGMSPAGRFYVVMSLLDPWWDDDEEESND